MKIFISWSGARSRKTAELLREWLPLINQDFDPFVSGEDISKGGNWSQTIIDELNVSDFGILCVTPGNQNKPWLLFEAGALSKQVANEPSLVAPLLIGFQGKRDLPPPLGRFQTTLPEREDMLKLVMSLNATCEPDRRRAPDILKTVFDKWWDEFQRPFQVIENSHPGHPSPRRSDHEVLAEVLDIVRSLQIQAVSSPSVPARAGRAGAGAKENVARAATIFTTVMAAYSKVTENGFSIIGPSSNPRNPAQPGLRLVDHRDGADLDFRLTQVHALLSTTGVDYYLELVGSE